MIPIGQASTAGNLTFKSTATIVAGDLVTIKVVVSIFLVGIFPNKLIEKSFRK
jgi:hypothetical protein